MINDAQVKLVKNKSIPNVDDQRLLESLNHIHSTVHTTEGLHKWDMPRRSLYDWGMKGIAIRKELTKRGVDTGIDCRWCGPEGKP
jgi:hypothetical protein